MNNNGVPEQIGASGVPKAIRARPDWHVGTGKIGTAIFCQGQVLVGARLLVEHCPETSTDCGFSDIP